MENSKLPSSRIHKESAFQFWTPGYRLHELKQRESRANTTQILLQEPFGHACICQIAFWSAATTRSQVVRPLPIRTMLLPSISFTHELFSKLSIHILWVPDANAFASTSTRHQWTAQNLKHWATRLPPPLRPRTSSDTMRSDLNRS